MIGSLSIGWHRASSRCGWHRASSRWVFNLPLLLALFLVPIVGHGCHGDDVDHEPSVHREAASGESSNEVEP